MTILYMLESTRGSPDAFAVMRYMEGRHYDIPDSLAYRFIGAGKAIEVPDEDMDGIYGATLNALPNKALAGSYMPGMTAVRNYMEHEDFLP